MRDLISNLGVKIAIPAASYAADNTPAAIDLRGFESAVFAIHVGVGGITFSGSNKVEFVLTHTSSSANGGLQNRIDSSSIRSIKCRD